MSEKRRVVVTGSGVVSCIGIGKDKFWESALAGKSGVSEITQFDCGGFNSRIAGEIKDFDPSVYFSFRDNKRTPRFVQFAIAAAMEAVEESKIDFSAMDPYRAGVVIGSGIGSLESVEKEYRGFLEKGPRKISPFLIPMLITNEAAGCVAIRFNLKGANFCTVTACASGAHAIGEAYRLIREERVDVVICGGTESCITSMGVGGFCSLKALSQRNDEPARASRPFDRERDGFVMSEGAGMVVLESLDFALSRNALIHAEICGYGATCDAYHITAPDPEGEAAAKAISMALSEAGTSKDESFYINAHGTSTQLNDKMETRAIKRVFGQAPGNVVVSSTKSMTGHMLGAAGAVEFIVCCLALRDRKIPPTINYENPDPECDLDYNPNKSRDFQGDFALSNSLGFGGHNATLLLKRYEGK